MSYTNLNPALSPFGLLAISYYYLYVDEGARRTYRLYDIDLFFLSCFIAQFLLHSLI